MDRLASRLSFIRPNLTRHLGTLAVLVFAHVVALVVTVLIARLFSKTDAGIIFFCTGLITISMSFTSIGLSTAAEYYYLRHKRKGRSARNVQTIALTLAVAIVPSLALGLFGLTITDGTTNVSMPLLVFVLAAACYFAVMRYMARQVFVIEGEKSWSLFYDSIIFNVALILAFIVTPYKTADAALWGMLIASALSGSFALVHLWRRATGGGPAPARRLPPKRYAKLVLSISVASMIAQAGSVLLNKIDVLMLGPIAGPEAAGDYSVAMRLTYITAFAGTALMALTTPLLLRVSAAGSDRERWTVMREQFGYQTAVVVAMAIPMFIFAEPLMVLVFGEEYRTGVTTFLVLQAGKLITAIFAPAAIMFTALGYNRDLARTMIVVAAINIGLNFVLIPPFGATGAAAATTVALLVMAASYILLMLRVRRRAMVSA